MNVFLVTHGRLYKFRDVISYNVHGGTAVIITTEGSNYITCYRRNVEFLGTDEALAKLIMKGE